MSLLQRMERAQQAKAAEAAAAAGETPASATEAAATQTPTVRAAPDGTAPDATAPTEATDQLSPSLTNGTAMVGVPIGPVSTSGLRGARAPVRDDLIREVRLHLQAAVEGAFKALLDAKENDVQRTIEGLVDRVIVRNGFAVTREERMRLVEEMVHDVTGFGPLEPLLADPTITEVMVNGPDHIYIERGGKIQRIDGVFLNDQHVLRVIERIITPLGRRIDESSPRVDARLPDGSRVNAVIEPLSLVGPVITVRKFSKTPYTVDDLIRFGTATPEMFDFLRACVEARLNVFVSGGTGSGKTTTLNVLSSFIPNDERIVTIEDAAELQLRQNHVVTLESRPPNLEGEGEITMRDLLRNALHMRPDRIIVGECRAGEALDMLQAMTTGQDGSLSTGHANSPQDMLRRLETMVLMTGYELPLRAIREQIASAVDLIVHTARLKDGSRKIVNITEVYGIEDDEILTQDIFTFEQTGYQGRQDRGRPQADRHPPDVHEPVPAGRRRAAAGRIRDPAARSRQAGPPAGRAGSAPGRRRRPSSRPCRVGDGRAVTAGGMVYVSSIGPVDRETGQIVPGLDQGADAPVHDQPEGQARGGRQLARQGRLGELVAA